MGAQEELRVEKVLEGVESLATAIVRKHSPSLTDAEREIALKQVGLAREELGEALHDIVAPVFRVVEGGIEGQSQQAEPEDQVICGKCKANKRCELGCPDWHEAIRGMVDAADETFPICEVCDMPNNPSILCCEKACPRRADGGLA